MKRFLFVVVPLLILVSLSNRITAYSLDRYLPPLLSDVFGLPVTLQPLRVQLMTLRAETDAIVIGPSSAPAVSVKKLMVRLDPFALLTGEIRFVNAHAEDLMVSVSRWPEPEGPVAENYFFLEQWLPDRLAVDAGYYLPANGSRYPIELALWTRPEHDRFVVSWQEQRGAGPIQWTVSGDSLYQILAKTTVTTQIKFVTPSKDDDTGVVSGTMVAKRWQSGWQMQTELDSPAITGTINTTAEESWGWPTQSSVKLNNLDLVDLRIVLDGLDRSTQTWQLERFLRQSTPALNLPDHQADISVAQISGAGVPLTDTTLSVTLAPASLKIESLSSNAPHGELSGEIDVSSNDTDWQAQTRLTLSARDSGGIAPTVVGEYWVWDNGGIELQGQGSTWGQLLNSLSGGLNLKGLYRGERDHPVALSASLDSGVQNALSLSDLSLSINQDQISGSLSLSGRDERKLTLDLSGDRLDLSFLADTDSEVPEPGISIPEYLGLFPGLETDISVAIRQLQGPSLSIRDFEVQFDRDPTKAALKAIAKGPQRGLLSLTMESITDPSSGTDLTLNLEMEEVTLRKLFATNVTGADATTSGSLRLSSSGSGIRELFESLEGRAELYLTIRENAYQGTPETIGLAGNASLELEQDRIIGLLISNLDIHGSTLDVTGNLSMTAGRAPWIQASLQASTVDVDQIITWLQANNEAVDDQDFLRELRDIGPVSVTLNADTLNWFNTPIRNARVELNSTYNGFSLRQIRAESTYANVAGQLDLRWQGNTANLQLNTQLTDIHLAPFIHGAEPDPNSSLAGTLTAHSEGETVQQLLQALKGDLDLSGTGAEAPSRHILKASFASESQGFSAALDQVQWYATDLTGSVNYRRAPTAELDINLVSEQLDLSLWEEPPHGKGHSDSVQSTPLATAAKGSSRVLRSVFSAPLQLLRPALEDEESQKDDRYFSQEKLPLEAISRFNTKLQASVGRITSITGEALKLELNASTAPGVLRINAQSPSVNGGSTSMDAEYRYTPDSSHLTLNAQFEDLHRTPERTDSSRSGILKVTSRGQSPAEIAANLNGKGYLELGKGPFNPRGFSFLTADVGSAALKTLLPKSKDDQEPQLRCAVSALYFIDGIMATPYGYAAQTRRANLIGHIQVDFIKEKLQIDFNSVSREGAGLNVGNVFSSTVEIKGPLTNPGIVPKTGGLLWRGWAAFMTGGMSLLGESVYKRALVAEDPCGDIKREIRKVECIAGAELAESALVCPIEQTATSAE